MSSISIASLSGGSVVVDDATLGALRGGIRGEVVTPADAQYDQVRAIWNAMIDRRPGLIVRCLNSSDVVTAVRFAREHDLLLSVRGAGHNIAGKSLADGALLIDLSLMRSVHVDASSRTARVDAGATLGDVDAETQSYGLALPVGINSTTGVAGLTLGGGFGWLSRKHGLTVDNLIAAHVVTAAGDRLWCSADQHSDLFWAIRGGGGNFGIVTSFEFQLHPVGPEVISGLIVHPFSAARDVLRAYRAFTASAPDAVTAWVVMRAAPPLPFLPPEVHGTKVLVLAAMYAGNSAHGADALAPLRKIGTPIADVIGPHPFAGWQQAFDPLLTPGARNYWKSHNFEELSDEAIDTLLKYVETLPGPQSEVFIAHLGGAVNTVSVEATAYPHRDAEYVVNVHTRWDDPADDQRSVAWARELYKATEPFATGGVYVNFISEGEDDRLAGAYGANMERLAEVKRDYDPDNVFRINWNIRPS